MERRRQVAAALDHHGMPAVITQYFDVVVHLQDLRCPDEDCFDVDDRCLIQFQIVDETVVLRTIGIAPHVDRHQAE